MTFKYKQDWQLVGELFTLLVVMNILLFSCSPAPAYAEAPTYEGISGGWLHTSDPISGQPWNDTPEATTDLLGAGPWFKWRKYEAHLWFGVKRDSISRIGRAESVGASIIIMRKWGRK